MRADWVVVWSAEAEMDMEEIFDFIAKAYSVELARRICRSIFSRTDHIKQFPRAGKRDPWLDSEPIEYRYVVKGSYRIVYCIDANQIQIVRVFDMRMDPSNFRIR